MLTDFGRIFAFILVGAIFVAAGLFGAWVLRPKRGYPGKLDTYECGEEPVGSPWVQFNIRFYVIALVFLIFDVEVVFLFPWAVVFQRLGMFAFIEMMVFLAILLVGYAYVWIKGDLNWEKPQPTLPTVPERRAATPHPVSDKVPA